MSLKKMLPLIYLVRVENLKKRSIVNAENDAASFIQAPFILGHLFFSIYIVDCFNILNGLLGLLIIIIGVVVIMFLFRKYFSKIRSDVNIIHAFEKLTKEEKQILSTLNYLFLITSIAMIVTAFFLYKPM